MKPFLALLLFLTAIGCKNISEEKSDLTILDDNTPPKESVTEIFTSTYNTKRENGVIVRDTVRKIESIIIDKDDRELGKNLYTTDGKIFNSEVYSYNAQGHKIGANLFMNGDQLTGYFVYDTDEEGREIKQELFNKANDEKIMQAIFRYLDSGKIKQQGALDQEGHFIPSHEFVFDQDGLELGYNIFQPYTTNKVFYTFKYTKFNDDGKWIERQAIKDGIVEAIFVRNFVTREI